MAKLTLTTTSAGYALATTLNANNALIEAALENTLSRDGTSPNTMSVALDMNSQLINNLAVPVNDQSAATKKYVDDIVTGFTNSATFSAALPYDVTGSWDFEALASFEAGLRVYDTVDGADYVSFVHDGTDFNITQVGTQEFTFPALDGGGLGFYSFADTIHMLSSASVNFYNAGKTEYIYMWHDGSAGVVDTVGADLSLKSISGTAPMWFSGTGYKFLEGAAAAADSAGYGQIWVKDNAPNDLYFTDDTGQDVQITSNGSLATSATSARAVKSADESITNDSTLTTDADLIVTIPAINKHYKLEAWLYVIQVDATPDFKMAFAASNALQLGRASYTSISSTAAMTQDNWGIAGTQSILMPGGVAVTAVHIVGMFQSNATTAGTLGIQWAQNTSDANATQLNQGSWMEITQLD